MEDLRLRLRLNFWNILAPILLSVLPPGAAPHAAARTPQTAEARRFALLNTVKVGGEGSWDYLQYDALRQRLYIARVGGTLVLTGPDLKPAGSIAARAGTRVHGVALAEPLHLGFTGDGADRTSTVFDLASLKVLRRVKLPHAPDAVAYDPYSHAAVAVAEDAPSLMAFDPRTGRVIAEVKLPGSPEAAVADGRGHLFVTLSDVNEIATVDTRRWRVEAHTAIGGGCEEPTPVSLDDAGRRLFVGCRSRVMAVLDTRSRRLLASTSLCDGVDTLIYEARSRTALASCNEGVLDVFDAASREAYPLRQAVVTAPGARTMAFDERRQRAYLPVADKGPLLPKTEDVPARPAIVPETFRILTLAR